MWEWEWRRYKRLVQPPGRNKLCPPEMKLKTYNEKLFRMGAHSLVQWDGLIPARPKDRVEQSAIVKLQVQYLRATIKRGIFYSYAIADEPDAGVRCVRALETNMSGRKWVKTCAANQVHSQAFPVLLQELVPWSVSATSMDVLALGDATVEDFAKLAP